MPGQKKENLLPSVSDSITDADIVARVQEYEKDFDLTGLTTIDRTQIRRLATMELTTDALLSTLNEMRRIGEYSAGDLKAVNDSLKTISAEARQLATALGIDRKSRMTEKESELDRYVPET